MYAKDKICKVILFVDDENKDYTVDYTYHSDEGRFHSETTVIFGSIREAERYIRGIVTENKADFISTTIDIVVE